MRQRNHGRTIRQGAGKALAAKKAPAGNAGGEALLDTSGARKNINAVLLHFIVAIRGKVRRACGRA
jgi:hypothetical protein